MAMALHLLITEGPVPDTPPPSGPPRLAPAAAAALVVVGIVSVAATADRAGATELADAPIPGFCVLSPD